MTRRLCTAVLVLVAGVVVYVPAKLQAAGQPADANECVANCLRGSCGASGSGCVCYCWGAGDQLPRCECSG